MNRKCLLFHKSGGSIMTPCLTPGHTRWPSFHSLPKSRQSSDPASNPLPQSRSVNLVKCSILVATIKKKHYYWSTLILIKLNFMTLILITSILMTSILMNSILMSKILMPSIFITLIFMTSILVTQFWWLQF